MPWSSPGTPEPEYENRPIRIAVQKDFGGGQSMQEERVYPAQTGPDQDVYIQSLVDLIEAEVDYPTTVVAVRRIVQYTQTHS